MLLSPIIDRELRLSARNWRTYYSRSLVAFWALALCLYLIFTVRAALGGPAVGAQILLAGSMLALALCLFNGVNRTCDCLSAEKRDGTLGLLFLTHLKGRDIVLGKLLTNGLRATYLLFAILPILAIPVFLGGVTGAELIRLPVVLLNSLLLSLSIGLLISALLTSQRAAYATAAGIVAFLAILLPATAVIVQRTGKIPWLPFYLNMPSPAYALQMSFGSSFGLKSNLFWTAIALQFGMAMIALIAACLLVPHFWTTRTSKWQFNQWLTRLAYGSTKVRARRRSRMLELNPIHWLRSRDRFAALGPILFAVVTLSVAAASIIYYEIPRVPAFVILFATLAVNDFSMRIRVGSLASLNLGNDRQSGALEMLLSTPLTVNEIVRGIWRSIRRKLLWAYIPLLLTYLVTALLFFNATLDARFLLAMSFIVISLIDFAAMGYVAMWNGMRMKNVQHAAGRALLRVGLLPWALWAAVMPFMAEFIAELNGQGGFVVALVIWSISTGLALRSARRKLFTHFREAATDRYTFEKRTSLTAWLRRCFDNSPAPNLLRPDHPAVLN